MLTGDRRADAAIVSIRQSILVIVMTCSAAVQGLAAPEPPFQRVRAGDAVLLRSLREGFRRSPTFRSIVLELERSNVIVYVTPGLCELGRIAGCLLRFVGVSGHDRYLRVLISPVLT
ncbi:MAG: hypothetical protein M3545_16280, partial [Acidobacteriota bacterium]|nr:hypothetical protein [Acidobacteriota bacterium]